MSRSGYGERARSYLGLGDGEDGPAPRWGWGNPVIGLAFLAISLSWLAQTMGADGAWPTLWRAFVCATLFLVAVGHGVAWRRRRRRAARP